MDALGHGDQQPPALGPLLLDGGQELLLVKVGLGQVHQVLTGHLAANRADAAVIHPALRPMSSITTTWMGRAEASKASSRADTAAYLGCAPKARAVVGDRQVIVDGLGDADDPQLIAGLAGQLVDLVAGVHGVVAAVVEKVADVELLEALQHRG